MPEFNQPRDRASTHTFSPASTHSRMTRLHEARAKAFTLPAQSFFCFSANCGFFHCTVLIVVVYNANYTVRPYEMEYLLSFANLFYEIIGLGENNNSFCCVGMAMQQASF